ncbi:putative exocyst complex component sec5 [Phaeomoniella chlamydospora]|uniref:Exocyst complex component SEC5 n=1 Tax=Phaeomoniella chlamydospora TaxID=158046 RepID=A0A0G2GIS4_PHACM|nr:putative exocyst complex component sec5 [Phaeomoniella chlamydospora]
MAAVERDVVSHYNLTSAYPTEWPAELDESDEEEKDGSDLRRSKSRYSALERSASDRRSMIPGSQKTGDGRANLVQKDEPDPLGGLVSVVQILRKKGLPVDEDTRTRNKFLLSSTTFSPAIFLSQVHSDATTDSLLQGLDYLTRSIDQKSASLKVLVESNFERFVRAKATIDNVYTEMRSQGAQNEPQSRPQSRHVSRQSGHYRNFSSGSFGGSAPSKPQLRKNALVKESEFGVIGIKAPLLEITQKAEDVWGPALEGREREDHLKAATQAIDQDRSIYELGTTLAKVIKQRDYEAVVDHYNNARRHSNNAKALAEKAATGQQQISDQQIHQILVTGRMWIDVEHQIKVLKRELWKKLSSLHSSSPTDNVNAEEHMELIGVLLELGVDENPIWVWLRSRDDYLKSKISALTERSRVEIEILRRRLTTGEKPNAQTSATYLRRAGKESSSEPLDTDGVIEMWEVLLAYLNKLLSMSSGILGEVVDFWETTQSFITGEKQKSLPTGFEGSSRHHHKLSDAGIKDLQKGVTDLVTLIRESVFALFADAPIEDISSLFSPLPPNSPNTPLSAMTSLSPRDPRFGAKLDPKNLPPPSPRMGEAWEEFAFWPPHSNTLSAVQYLSKSLVLVGTAASEMIAIKPVAEGPGMYDNVKTLVSVSRERCVKAVCAAWNKDAESCKNLEDWTRAPDQREQTKMPRQFIAFEQALLMGIQRILYISEATTRPGTGDVITPPPTKLLQMVRSQFVTSIYKALSGMVENAEKPIKVDEDEWIIVNKTITKSSSTTSLSSSEANNPTIIVADTIDASSRNVRMLLTLSNLKALRQTFVPDLISLFETNFSVKLTDESKTIRDVLSQIDSRLFQSYVRPTVSKLNDIIRTGISSPSWAPKPNLDNKPSQVRPYVYNVMLTLVLIHTEIVTTTSLSSVHPILTHHLEQISSSLLQSFSTFHSHYTLPALMQATLDVEFIAQTLTQYSSEKASQIQSQIYLELDRRTDNNARQALQQELPEMRGSLKKLRESCKGVYGCFRRDRSAAAAAAGGASGSAGAVGGSGGGGGGGGGGVGGGGGGVRPQRVERKVTE